MRWTTNWTSPFSDAKLGGMRFDRPPSARTLVTGFLAFGPFIENPSALLARCSCRPFETIEVAYAAADSFVESFPAERFDRVVLMGVAGGSDVFRLERLARNRIGQTPDVRGITPPHPHIDDASAPVSLPTTLWTDQHLARHLSAFGSHAAPSDDAGDYLCNYLYRRMLTRWPTHRIGFLHVPPISAMSVDRQRPLVERLLDRIEAD